MKRTEAIEWLKNIKEKYIHGGDDFYDCQRRTAIDYAMSVLENIEKKPTTNADRFRAMSNEEQQKCVRRFWEIEDFADWLKQPMEGE